MSRLFTIFFITLACSIRTSYGDDPTPKKLICGALGDCTDFCTDNCGCDGMYFYNKDLNECIFNIQKFKYEVTEKYDHQAKIRDEADNTFRGITIAAVLFLFCYTICIISACIYCCRISYWDYKLDKHVQALAQKLKRDGKIIKPQKEPLKPMEETCNIVVQEAGVFVV